MTSADDDKPGRLDRVVGDVTEKLLAFGVDGHGPLRPASVVAERARRGGRDQAAAVRRIVAVHTRAAAAEGFVTGLGGFVVLPIAIPANIVGFYTVATQMVGALAAANGYDTADADVRRAILVALSGEDATAMLRRAGVRSPASGVVTSRVLSGLPPNALMVINKGIAFRVVTGLGRHGLAWLGRAVPLAGGVIGAALDAVLLRRIAKVARELFPPRAEVVEPASAG